MIFKLDPTCSYSTINCCRIERSEVDATYERNPNGFTCVAEVKGANLKPLSMKMDMKRSGHDERNYGIDLDFEVGRLTVIFYFKNIFMSIFFRDVYTTLLLSLPFLFDIC